MLKAGKLYHSNLYMIGRCRITRRSNLMMHLIFPTTTFFPQKKPHSLLMTFFPFPNSTLFPPGIILFNLCIEFSRAFHSFAYSIVQGNFTLCIHSHTIVLVLRLLSNDLSQVCNCIKQNPLRFFTAN